MKFSKSNKIYLGLLVALTFFSIVNILVAKETGPIRVEFINIAIMVILYGALGFLGLKVTAKIGFPGIWDSQVTNRARFWFPLRLGVALGGFFILVDVGVGQFHSLGLIPQPEFWSAFTGTIISSLGEEILFRLFYVSVWLWLMSSLTDWLFGEKFIDIFFWLTAVTSGILFSLAYLPAIAASFELNNLGQAPILLWVEVFLIKGSLALAASYYLRKYGLLAAIGVHFWSLLVWQVVWGTLTKL